MTTRRELGVLALGVALAVEARAGPTAGPSAPLSSAPVEGDETARALAYREKHAAVVRRAARAIGEVEPAFVFIAVETRK